MKLSQFAFFFSIIVPLVACHELAQVANEIGNYPSQNRVPTANEISAGLKAALEKGSVNGVSELAKVGGYLNNPKLKIPFPSSAIKIKNSLLKLGFENEVNRVVTSLNEAAEHAVSAAKPLFINAIKGMTINDAKDILFGSDTSATFYLKENTSTALRAEFKPIIQNSLDEVNATKYWTDITTIYNKLPLVEKVNTDLAGYVTSKAINGLFIKIADEEAAIRENPIERTSELLKNVFGYADKNKDN